MPIEENLSAILARRAGAAVVLGDWAMVEALAHLLAELEIRDVVREAGNDAWKALTDADTASLKSAMTERVREVPLIKVPMRDDQARPVDGPAVHQPMICRYLTVDGPCVLRADHPVGPGFPGQNGHLSDAAGPYAPR